MSRYTSKYTGSEIDEAIGRVLPNGVIDTALANKAPAGYGLGGSATKTVETDFNNYIDNGVYAIPGSMESIQNAPPRGAFGMLIVSHGSSAIVQDVYSPDWSSSAVRWNHVRRVCTSYDGNADFWSEWEWPEPPMEPGVEYRTTERCNGKPVYAKFLYVGNIGKGSSVTICFENDASNRTSEYIVYIEGYSFSNNRYFVPSKVSVTDARARGVGTITLKNADTAYNSDANYVWVKYTKKTD